MDEESKRIDGDGCGPCEAPAKSIVQVYFPDRNTKLAYFNDRFDLRIGDIVYVEGKLEGLRGQVVGISHNFKIKVSDYKRIIGKADTAVKGRLYLSDSHFIAFSRDVIPYEKVLTWYKAPDKEDDKYISGNDDTSFSLEDMKGMRISGDVAQRGHEYYLQNRVIFLCLDGTRGRAMVMGTKVYEVEFLFKDGRISNLVCDCFCSYTCKHKYAVMLQLKETLETLQKDSQQLADGYWAAISKAAFFNAVLADGQNGSLFME